MIFKLVEAPTTELTGTKVADCKLPTEAVSVIPDAS